MKSKYEKKKQPVVVRRKLLDCATDIAARQGLAAVTIQAVAEAAGVTKGGLLHHFPNKRALIEAVYADLILKMDEEIVRLLQKDSVPYGRFTRAYIGTALHFGKELEVSPWSAIFASIITDVYVKTQWNSWMAKRLLEHADTDSDPELEMIRFAADGIWLAEMTNGFAAGTSAQHLYQQLIQRTYKETVHV